MATENNIIIINERAEKKLIIEKSSLPNVHIVDFSDYTKIEKIFKKNKSKNLEIYDITSTIKNKKVVPINDHINRIGHNPFIGKQKNYKIDFINIEHLYEQDPEGVITNSCGDHKIIEPYPSTHIANIAILGHILGYTIKAFLVKAEKQI